MVSVDISSQSPVYVTVQGSRQAAVGVEGSSCLLVALHPSNMLVYLRDGSALAVVHAATMK